MAILKPKKHIINSKGVQEDLNIYSTRAEACDIGLPCKQLEVMIDGVKTTGFIGLTDEIDKAKASSKRVQIGDKVYAERKYMGVRSMCNWLSTQYPETYKTMTEIPEGELPDTSDCQDFSYAFSGGLKLDHMSELDTGKGINFEGIFNFNEYRSLLPNMDTSNGKNFSRFIDSCVALVTMGVNTEKGETFEAFAHNCPELVSITELNTSKAKDISRLVDECTGLTDIPPIHLTQFEYEDIMINGKAENAFRNTSSLGELTFNDVPIGLTEEDVRQAMNIMPSCSIVNLNYRSTVLKTPRKTLKTENKELVETNVTTNNVGIVREGSVPLSNLIKHKEEWGTIYSDSIEDNNPNPTSFGCFITPDNMIYVGNSYENIADTTVDGKYGVTSFANGNLELIISEDTESNELKCIQPSIKGEGDYIISYETADNFSIGGAKGTGVNGFNILKDEPNKKSYMFHLDSTAQNIIFEIKNGETHRQGFETVLNKLMIVKSSVELPYIPRKIIVPKTRITLRHNSGSSPTFRPFSIIMKDIDFGKKATFNLFSRELGNNGLTCVVEDETLKIDLLFNYKNSCVTKGLTEINSSSVMDFKDFEIVGDTNGVAIFIKSINIFDEVMSKDELRKANENIS